MGFQKGHKFGNRFSRKNQPNNPGRKRSRINEVTDLLATAEYTKGFSKEDILKLMWFLIICNKNELEEMARHPDIPMIISTLIRGIVLDLKTGKTDTIDQILDRTIGKSSRSIAFSRAITTKVVFEKPKSRMDLEIELKRLQGKLQ